MVGSQVRRQNLDRHVAGQAGISGSIHFAHAAAADEREDLVAAESNAGAQSQGDCCGQPIIASDSV